MYSTLLLPAPVLARAVDGLPVTVPDSGPLLLGTDDPELARQVLTRLACACLPTPIPGLSPADSVRVYLDDLLSNLELHPDGYRLADTEVVPL